MDDYKYHPILGKLLGEIKWPINQAPLNELRGKLWISIKDERPVGSPIVWMYSTENNEFSLDHFSLSRGGVKVTHWQPLIGPAKEGE